MFFVLVYPYATDNIFRIYDQNHDILCNSLLILLPFTFTTEDKLDISLNSMCKISVCEGGGGVSMYKYVCKLMESLRVLSGISSYLASFDVFHVQSKKILTKLH